MDLSNETIIYGGSFDPVHSAHISIADNLCRIFKTVLVVPCRISPFKPVSLRVLDIDRINMLKLALENNKAKLNLFEMERDAISYTIDTVNQFYKGRKLFIAVGSENLPFLHKWKAFESIREKACFYVIPRSGFTSGETQATGLLPSDYVFATFNAEDISSAAVKLALAFGKGSDMLSANVYEYIKSRELYTDYFKYTHSFPQFSLTEKRISHTYRAALEGIVLAKRFGEDVDKTVTVLILHDIGKYATAEDLSAAGIKADYPLIPINHGRTGALIAGEYFKIRDEDILNAIRYHTSSRPNMSRLEEIVALADYIEPYRYFSGIEKIRDLSRKDLSRAAAAMLFSKIDFLNKNNREVYSPAPEALKNYKERGLI